MAGDHPRRTGERTVPETKNTRRPQTPEELLALAAAQYEQYLSLTEVAGIPSVDDTDDNVAYSNADWQRPMGLVLTPR
jgi:hypothetical protein